MSKEILNPYGTEWNEILDGSKCEECGIKHQPKFIIFEFGYPDPIVFCSQECVLRHFQNRWSEKVIEYCNEKVGHR